MTDQIEALSESLVDELVGAVGLPKTRFTHGLFWGLFRGLTNKLAVIGAPFDQKVGEHGLPEGSAWCLTHFCDDVLVSGTDNIPKDGPLLVVANHPGAYDGLVLFSQVGRKDTKWISTEIPFLDMLVNTREHIFFASREDASNRMVVMRNAIKHLKAGGTLVYFAAGHRDADPAVFPGSQEAMAGWLDIFDTFFKYVPGLQILPAVLSGVVSKYWANHPITRLRRKQIDKHRLAEFGQVITQLLKPGRLMITPRLSFGEAVNETQLRAESVDGRVYQAVVARGQKLLQAHCREFGGCLE